MNVTNEIISPDDFEEIGEFDMPLEKDAWMNIDIDKERKLLGLDTIKKNPKMVYKVPVVWSMMGYVLVDAEGADEALIYAVEHLDEFDLPRNGEYLEDSFEVDTEGVVTMIGAYYGD